MVNLSENEKHQILEQRKTIMEITSHELKVVKKIIVIDGVKDIVEETDYRAAFIESVQTYASLLYCYMDCIMSQYYSKHIIYLSGWWNSEALPLITDKAFLQAYKDAPEFSTDNKTTQTDLMMTYQIREAKGLFLQLNLFCQRVNLLSDSLKQLEEERR
jgi:hypothetical protein